MIYKLLHCMVRITLEFLPVAMPWEHPVLQKHRGGCKLKHATEDLKGLFRAFHDLPKGALEEPLLLHRSIS